VGITCGGGSVVSKLHGLFYVQWSRKVSSFLFIAPLNETVSPAVTPLSIKKAEPALKYNKNYFVSLLVSEHYCLMTLILIVIYISLIMGSVGCCGLVWEHNTIYSIVCMGNCVLSSEQKT